MNLITQKQDGDADGSTLGTAEGIRRNIKGNYFRTLVSQPFQL